MNWNPYDAMPIGFGRWAVVEKPYFAFRDDGTRLEPHRLAVFCGPGARRRAGRQAAAWNRVLAAHLSSGGQSAGRTAVIGPMRQHRHR